MLCEDTSCYVIAQQRLRNLKHVDCAVEREDLRFVSTADLTFFHVLTNNATGGVVLNNRLY